MGASNGTLRHSSGSGTHRTGRGGPQSHATNRAAPGRGGTIRQGSSSETRPSSVTGRAAPRHGPASNGGNAGDGGSGPPTIARRGAIAGNPTPDGPGKRYAAGACDFPR